MGSALAAAMGVAEAVPDRLVVALRGDGELLVGAATWWSVSAYRPGNLIAVVLSDGVYGITGGQQLSAQTRFAAVAEALGGIAGTRVRSEPALRTALRELGRPSLLRAEPSQRAWPGPSPFVDPARGRLAFAANAAAGTGERQPRQRGNSATPSGREAPGHLPD